MKNRLAGRWFYLRYAANHLLRESQRTLFVLFCIAVGVAAVFSLRDLGLMIRDALSSDLRESNRADMVIRIPVSIDEKWQTRLADGSLVQVDQSLFDKRSDVQLLAQSLELSHSGLDRVRRWADVEGFTFQPAWISSGPFTGIRKSGIGTSQEYIQVYCIDPVNYPFYGSIEVKMPAGVVLSQVLSQPRQIAISEQLLEKPGFQLGDQVFLIGAPGAFSVSAVISSKSEATLTNPMSVVFSFAYLSFQTCHDVLKHNPNVVYVRVPDGKDIEAARSNFVKKFPGLSLTTIEDLRHTTQQFSLLLTRLVTVMGLVSLLIGGIGIANTMQVTVSRRTPEIAVLKTIGVKGGQILQLFLVEALILGVVGSLLGLGLGVGLVFLLRQVGESFVSQNLQFAIYPEALGMGFLPGLGLTLAFGLLPALAAGQVRPNRVLHPEVGGLPQVGWLLSLLVWFLLVVLLGLVVGQILGNWEMGFVGAFGMAFLLGLSALLLRWVVWFLSHLPALGIAPIKLAQRGLSTHLGRAANTLLALTGGIFSISLVWVLVQGTLKLVATNAENYLGGNVLAAVQSLEDGQALERKLAQMPGVVTFVHDTIYPAEVVAINSNPNMKTLITEAAQRAADTGATGNVMQTIDTFVKEFDMKVLEEDTWNYQVRQGRDLSPLTALRNVESQKLRNEMLLEMLSSDDVYRWFDLQPGDTLTFKFPGGGRRTARIVGLVRRPNIGALLQGLIEFRSTYGIVQPRFVPPYEQPVPSMYYITIEEQSLAQVMDELAVMPGIFVVESRQFNIYTERFAESFVPLPLIIAGLALFASSVIIANTVALAVLERRRQIGVMKAIGLQTEHILGMLLLENALLGISGGLLGVFLGAGVVVGGGFLGDGLVNLPMDALALLVILAILLALGATWLAAWGAAQEKPLKVLRYE
jgi:putative ABC transport system permease protein